MKIHITTGNSKIGETHNISLPPIISCKKDIPCFDRCYAVKFYKGYPEARKAWDENWEIYNKSSRVYFKAINSWLTKYEPKYFRWHVSGDCPNQEYYDKVLEIACIHRKTNFLMYTKQYTFVKDVECIPSNLTVMLSMWPYIKDPMTPLPYIWVTGDLRCPETAFLCTGLCDTCRQCWKGVKDIAIKLH